MCTLGRMLYTGYMADPLYLCISSSSYDKSPANQYQSRLLVSRRKCLLTQAPIDSSVMCRLGPRLGFNTGTHGLPSSSLSTFHHPQATTFRSFPSLTASCSYSYSDLGAVLTRICC